MTKKVIDDGLRNLSLDIVSRVGEPEPNTFFKEPEPNSQEPESFLFKSRSRESVKKGGSFGLPNTDCQLLKKFRLNQMLNHEDIKD